MPDKTSPGPQDGGGQKAVQVLMATYNGGAYLKEQLDSILSQRGVRVSLLARDDGSSDRTPGMLAAYARGHGNVSVYAGERLGAAGSFYDLLAHADASADYYAFADQDDVWLGGKLARAVGILEGLGERRPGRPLLYAGGVAWASADLGRQGAAPCHIGRPASFGNALVENICMGCTQVFNRPLLELARGHLPSGGALHDWWMYLTAAYFGHVAYDRRAYMLYRQHGGNQVGMQRGWASRWGARARRAGQLRHKLSRQAADFREAYGPLLYGHADLDPDLGPPGQAAGFREAYGRPQGGHADPGLGLEGKRAQLELLCGYREGWRERLALIRDRGIYRQGRLDDAVCRMLFLVGFL